MIMHVLEKAAEASLAASLTPAPQAKAAETKPAVSAPIAAVKSVAKSVKGKGKAVAAAAGLTDPKEDEKAKEVAADSGTTKHLPPCADFERRRENILGKQRLCRQADDTRILQAKH